MSLGNLMKQAKKMQEDLQKAQDEIARLQVVGESGAGLVKVTMTGKYEVTQVAIDPSLFKEDKETVEDLVGAAINDAVRKIGDASKGKFSGIMSGVQLPPGFDLPTGG